MRPAIFGRQMALLTQVVLCLLFGTYHVASAACVDIFCTCTQSMIDCSNTEPSPLVEIPDVNAAGVGYVSMLFQNNQIVLVAENTFYGQSRLELLDLSNNKIKDIEDRAFNGLDNLITLNLDSNELIVVYAESFEGLTNLQTLDLSFNKLSSLSSYVFKPMPDIRSLIIDGNTDIVELQGDLFRNSRSLRRLWMNLLPKLETLPISIFTHTPQLAHLQMVNNSLTEFPAEALSRLRPSLSMFMFGDNNNIKTIPNFTFANFAKLDIIHLKLMPELTEIGSWAFTNLTNLQRLHLMNCSKLQYIQPLAFQLLNLKNTERQPLKEVKMNYNGLTHLSDTLLPWERIEQLDLQSNQWRCYCDIAFLAELGHLMKKTEDNFKCVAPKEHKGHVITKMKPDSFYCIDHSDRDGRRHAALGVAIGVTCALLFAAGVTVALYKMNFLAALKKKGQARYLAMYNMEVKREHTDDLVTGQREMTDYKLVEERPGKNTPVHL